MNRPFPSNHPIMRHAMARDAIARRCEAVRSLTKQIASAVTSSASSTHLRLVLREAVKHSYSSEAIISFLRYQMARVGGPWGTPSSGMAATLISLLHTDLTPLTLDIANELHPNLPDQEIDDIVRLVRMELFRQIITNLIAISYPQPRDASADGRPRRSC